MVQCQHSGHLTYKPSGLYYAIISLEPDFMDKSVRAVITGDLVRSRLFLTRRTEILDKISSVLKQAAVLEDPTHDSVRFSQVFRGDSFQGLVIHPERALKILLAIRAELLQSRIDKHQLDVRLGLGIGLAENINIKNIEASDGEAFRLSGRALDLLKGSQQKYRRFFFLAAEKEMNPGLAMLAATLDAIIQSWSVEQAEAVSYWLQDRTQSEISRILKIKQPAVQQRLRLAGHYALKAGLEYYESLFHNKPYDL